MSATKKEMEIFLSYIPTIYPVILPKFELLKIFHKNNRKKSGPNFTIFLKDELDDLYCQYIDINKDPANINLNPDNIFEWPKPFYTGFYRIDKIKRLERGLKIHDEIPFGTIDTDNKDSVNPEIYLDTNKEREIFKFVADFFKVPFISKEEDLIKEYGENVKCIQCGRCCRHYRKVRILASDRKRWLEEGRRDILEETRWSYLPIKDHKSGHCPFLVKNKCSIQDMKPKHCKEWPKTLLNRAKVKCKSLIKE